MDKAAIRAKAKEICLIMNDYLNNEEDMALLVTALTEVYEQGKQDGALEAVRRFGDSGMEATMKFFGLVKEE